MKWFLINFPQNKALILRSFFHFRIFKKVIWSSACDKSLSPDGFTMGFYKASWDIIKQYFFYCVNDFFLKARLPNSIMVVFITLISKNHNSQGLNEYCPIYLIESVYRIVSKLLAERQKNVIGKLVSINRSTFIPNRSMLDGVVVVNELVNFARRNKKNMFIFKVNFVKSFDSVS